MKTRSLDRGILLLEILAGSGARTLSELCRESGIPKSTVKRLLATLQARRLVRHSISDRKFRNNVTMPMAGPPVPREMAALVDTAMPVLTELTHEIEWPSDVHVVDGHTMRVGDTTRPLSPFLLHGGVLNRPINMFAAATGQACLSAMTPAAVAQLMAKAEADPVFGPAGTRLSRNQIFDGIERARQRGYGVRLSEHLGEPSLNDRLAAIAVPVIVGGAPLGAISLLFPRQLMTAAAMADRHLDKLRAAATKIAVEVEKLRKAIKSP